MEGHHMGPEAWMILAGVVTQIILGLVAFYGMAVRNDGILEAMRMEIKELKETMKELSKVVTDVAVANQRMDTIEKRQLMSDNRVDNLARGNGWERERRTAVDGEQPY